MAASILPWPGSPAGPCEDACDHRDCAATRQQVASTCRLCGSPIGFGRRFYQDDGSVGRSALVHASCYEDEIEHQKGRRC